VSGSSRQQPPSAYEGGCSHHELVRGLRLAATPQRDKMAMLHRLKSQRAAASNSREHSSFGLSCAVVADRRLDLAPCPLSHSSVA